MAAPPTGLTSVKGRFEWTPDADVAFTTLRQRFTSAPILVVPDPEKQFVVEVDVSDVGVGAVLSQRSSTGQETPPVCFLLSLFVFRRTEL